ncbi:integral membrane protein, putative [Theileria annulata]|uniref:Integral membrane protein, putative n=1 Tax=Theileria annulata TaxID=5874 RepID=Q4UH92_THEAN|nr:integral membrane protein, putative [Theileria annulata]CAI73547.1 integral membrane protein, putative [Theileria annulata]|eukprot:XP_954224.1 integral membrane protein, putative [Theileria annulata]
MRLKRISRKLCIFLIGFNLLLPIHYLYYISYNFFYIKLSTIITIISIILGSMYLLIISPKYLLTHFNKLFVIILNFITLFYYILLIFFKNFKIIFILLICYSFILGLNESFSIIIDPINIPFFLLGFNFSNLFSSFLYYVTVTGPQNSNGDNSTKGPGNGNTSPNGPGNTPTGPSTGPNGPSGPIEPGTTPTSPGTPPVEPPTGPPKPPTKAVPLVTNEPIKNASIVPNVVGTVTKSTNIATNKMITNKMVTNGPGAGPQGPTGPAGPTGPPGPPEPGSMGPEPSLPPVPEPTEPSGPIGTLRPKRFGPMGFGFGGSDGPGGPIGLGGPMGPGGPMGLGGPMGPGAVGPSTVTGDTVTIILIIGLIISIIIIILCIYVYGGNGLFNIIGIKIKDFILDNSEKKLNEENEKYEKYLNDKIKHKIKNLEYEIILKPNLIQDYNIKNIINLKKIKKYKCKFSPLRCLQQQLPITP